MKTRGELATVGRYGAVWEAEIVRDRLDAAGIQAFVQGSETGRSLSYVGVALGGVRVQVPAEDLEAARQVLSEDARQRMTAGDWRCPRCEEPNDASFDLCWSCALPREAAAAEPVAPPLAPQEIADERVEERDPYRSPHFGGAFGEVETRGGFLVAMVFVAILIAATIAVLMYGGPK